MQPHPAATSPIPRPSPLPEPCSALPPAQVGDALRRGVSALSAQLVGESAAARAAHLANCVYSYDRPPYPVALTLNLAQPTGKGEVVKIVSPALGEQAVAGVGKFAVFKVDNRGGGILSIVDSRFDATLWTPDFANKRLLADLGRAIYTARQPPRARRAAPWPKRTALHYACEIFGPSDVAGVFGQFGARASLGKAPTASPAAVRLNASSATDGLCQYAASNPPYRVVATLTLEKKPPGTAFDLERIADLRLNPDNAIQNVPALPFGHFIHPMHRLGASLFFDTGTTLVTVTTPDRADRTLLERFGSAVQDALRRH